MHPRCCCCKLMIIINNSYILEILSVAAVQVFVCLLVLKYLKIKNLLESAYILYFGTKHGWQLRVAIEAKSA